MTEHRFSKSVADYASGALKLVRSRIAEHQKRTGHPPMQMLLHLPTARRLFEELAQEHRIDIPMELIVPGAQGIFGNVPFAICPCGNDFGQDELIDWMGRTEPL